MWVTDVTVENLKSRRIMIVLLSVTIGILLSVSLTLILKAPWLMIVFLFPVFAFFSMLGFGLVAMNNYYDDLENRGTAAREELKFLNDLEIKGQ